MPTLSRRSCQQLGHILAGLILAGAETFTSLGKTIQLGPLKHDINDALRGRTRKSTIVKRAAKRSRRRELVRDVRPRVVIRAGCVCECGCGRPVDDGSFGARGVWDEFRRRAKVKATVENSWYLRKDCGDAREAHSPSRMAWLHKYRAHVEKYGYAEEIGWVTTEIVAELLIEKAAETSGLGAGAL